MNAKDEILCPLCSLSALNLDGDGDGMAFGDSDEEETKAFSGTGM